MFFWGDSGWGFYGNNTYLSLFTKLDDGVNIVGTTFEAGL
jgi:hypothetical protein